MMKFLLSLIVSSMLFMQPVGACAQFGGKAGIGGNAGVGGGPASGPPAPLNLATDFWPMTEAVSSGTRYDLAGSNNLADTNSNVPYAPAVSCGSASLNMAKFSATTGVLKAGTNLTAATNTAWSISLWFYMPTDPVHLEIVHSSGKGQFTDAIIIYPDTSQVFLYTDTGGTTTPNSGSALTLNACHNVTISYTNNSTPPSMYLDNVAQVGASNISGGFIFNLFMNDDGNDYAPSGSYLTQVSWYPGTALTLTQVGQIWNSGTPQTY